MILPFPPRKPNLPNILPELKTLREIAHTNITEGIQHAANIIESKDTFSKTAAREIIELANEGPAKASEIVNSTAEQLGSIAKKTIETMKESESPIVQKTAETVENTPIINPEEIINKAKEAVNQVISDLDQTRSDVEKEIIKEVIKTKAKKGFLGFLKNLYTKIKQFVCNLLKFGNNS